MAQQKQRQQRTTKTKKNLGVARRLQPSVMILRFSLQRSRFGRRPLFPPLCSPDSTTLSHSSVHLILFAPSSCSPTHQCTSRPGRAAPVCNFPLVLVQFSDVFIRFSDNGGGSDGGSGVAFSCCGDGGCGGGGSGGSDGGEAVPVPPAPASNQKIICSSIPTCSFSDSLVVRHDISGRSCGSGSCGWC